MLCQSISFKAIPINEHGVKNNEQGGVKNMLWGYKQDPVTKQRGLTDTCNLFNLYLYNMV